jgi:hypothetical protein
MRVLFIGNSYTYVNDLPHAFEQLADSGGERVGVGMLAQGGWTLAQHASDAATTTALGGSRWDDVVLQEQSETPVLEAWRETRMYPAAVRLVSMIRAVHATPVFLVTWAHRDGWPDGGVADFASMQKALDDGYDAIASQLHAEVAPVGDAWRIASALPDVASLWQQDGSHPSLEGTYLAACVVFTTVFHRSPVHLSFTAGLPVPEALALQNIAARTVLERPTG